MRGVLGVGRLYHWNGEGGLWLQLYSRPPPSPSLSPVTVDQPLKLNGAEISADMYVGGCVWGVGMDE